MLLFVSIVVICMKLHKLFGILNKKTRKQHKQHEFIVFEKRKDKAWQEKLSHDFHCFKNYPFILLRIELIFPLP